MGATCADAVARWELANEVVLLDIKEGFAEGKALDIWQTAPINLFDSRLVGSTNDYGKTAGSDVVVITSKIVSKCEGRIVTAPTDADARDALRRKLIDDEAVRVLARKGRTLITENRNGLVQAAAGVDGSNVATTELALLPTDPDASARALRAELGRRLGVRVGVLVTDTMGRTWRNGQIDAAIGAAGVPVLHGYAGVRDAHGNELVVTEIAVADEIAAAADLVKGKLTAVPVAVVRGLSMADDGSTAAHLLRAGEDDLFWLGTAEAIEMG